ncbi:MAG: BatA domain-containing protein [Myxococcales bacterium]|nr:BatA domain-containing protein [Myxococcales bacterium]
MGLESPGLIWALGACLLPLLIHIVGRQKAAVVPFAAIEFLLTSDLLTAQRFVLKETWLMWIRTLLIAAVAGAMAQPYVSCASSRPLVARGEQAAVLIIDDSVASSYRLENGDLLARSKRQAREIIGDLGVDAELAIITTSDPTARHELTRNHLLLQQRLDAVTSTYRGSDLPAALQTAQSLLRASRHPHKSVIVLSPFAVPVETPAEQSLVVLDARPAGALPNVAITSLGRDAALADGEPGADAAMSVTATIANFGDRPLVGRSVRLYINNQVSARATIELPARGVVEKRFSINLPPGVASAEIEARLDDDAFMADNRRFMFAHRDEDVRALIINGAPHLSRYQDEAFFVQTAMQAAFRSQTPSVAGIEALEPRRIGAYDVIVLANVAALAPPLVEMLHAWVAGGGGLLITTGDQVDALAYNRTMAPLMPGQIGDIADAAWHSEPGAGTPALIQLAALDVTHPSFAKFVASDRALLQTSIRRRALLGSLTPGARVLASSSDGAPVLLEHAVGKGKIVCLLTTIDRDWSDFALQPGFAPWVEAIARHLARKVATSSDRSLRVGEAIVLPADESLRVAAPSGALTAVTSASSTTSRFAGTEVPGVYHVMQGVRDKPQPRHDLGFAVNIDPSASDLTHAPTSRSAVHAGSLPTQATHRLALAPWLLALAVLLLVLEGLWMWR